MNLKKKKKKNLQPHEDYFLKSVLIRITYRFYKERLEVLEQHGRRIAKVIVKVLLQSY